ncbi:zona pellucida sperm-binding protein 3-like isoform X2 [Brienomyrus brachyistius]|uniref:zona pellucida sperm-binding protein 3-like isoform X2 n=1 Tax=Brienomyrus brachyistius TaxID=42636 RepID=UPI0020B1D6FE|nr:zona pellucida sperm-binding protein 3-like isoform X2 [Brienomyrus brachyistius]
MGTVEVTRLIVSLTIISLVTDCYYVVPELSSAPTDEHRQPYQLGNNYASPNLPKTVSVKCRESELEIAVKADLYNIGTPIEGSDLRLGADPAVRESCKAKASGPSAYTIIADLKDCGTHRMVIEDSLIYANLLVYSPKPSRIGIVRMKCVVIPIECRYRRRLHVESSALKPTWMPMSSAPSGDLLDFSLKLMSSDWRAERTSPFYFLGDFLYIQASVRSDSRLPLTLFVDSCVATLHPSQGSHPRYSFLENNGCLIDTLLTGSGSMILPRVQQTTLQFLLEAFVFPRQLANRLYITCHLVATVSGDAVGAKRRACSLVDGRWRSADGNDWVCGGCDTYHRSGRPIWSSGPGSRQRPTSISRDGIGTLSGMGGVICSIFVLELQLLVSPILEWEMEITMGPVIVLRNKGAVDALFPNVPPQPSGAYWRPAKDSIRDWQNDGSSHSILDLAEDDDLPNRMAEKETAVGPITHERNGTSVVLQPQADVGLTSSLVLLGELSSKPAVLRKKDFIHLVPPSHPDGSLAQMPVSHP